jgi:PAS domain-containing protein
MVSLRNLAPGIIAPHWIEPAGAGADRLLALPAAWQCDLSDESLRWDSGVFDLFGIPRGARIDRREVLGFYCDDSREELERLRSEALAQCGSFTFEARIRRPDGETRWMRVTADVAMSGGRARQLYGLKQDITAEMAAAGH